MRHGVLLIDKPAGCTSHDVVQQVRKSLHERSIGHIGTLDPAATGLLVLFVGRKALKCVELFNKLHKEYDARITFGKLSTTYDSEGVLEEIAPKSGWEPPSQVKLLEVLNSKFLGEISQVPPAHSAVHTDGQRAYEVIRSNPQADLQLPTRKITVSAIQLISYGFPHCCLKIACSSGTYIRSIAHDLGQILRCGGYLSGLRRTRIGCWKIEDAHNSEHTVWAQVIPLKEVLADLPRLNLTDAQWKDIQHGKIINVALTQEPTIGWFGELPVAILVQKDGQAHPRKVL